MLFLNSRVFLGLVTKTCSLKNYLNVVHTTKETIKHRSFFYLLLTKTTVFVIHCCWTAKKYTGIFYKYIRPASASAHLWSRYHNLNQQNQNCSLAFSSKYSWDKYSFLKLNLFTIFLKEQLHNEKLKMKTFVSNLNSEPFINNQFYENFSLEVCVLCF